jgi:hypothetical protein
VDGEDHEYAWRYVANTAGWIVLGKTWAGTVFVINPGKRMTAARFAIARSCRWPSAHYRNREARMPWLLRWLMWQGDVLAGVLVVLWLPL